MKKYIFICFGFLIFASGTIVKAQDETASRDNLAQQADQPRRPNLMEALGLTQDQRQQIRRINTEKKPPMRQAQENLREAERLLDEAIYADLFNEVDVQTRVKNVQAAQFEIIKVRAATEIAIRRILTSDQLAKFRDVRRNFMKLKQTQRDRRNDSRINLPNNNRQRRLKPNN